jgi:pyruvate/2-oxoacid:ferredoxin oxidoreductase alpha subunit
VYKANKLYWICAVLAHWNSNLQASKNLTFDLWSWKAIGFQIPWRTKYVPSLVQINWRMLILECSQGCYRENIRPCDLADKQQLPILLSLLKVVLNTTKQTNNKQILKIRYVYIFDIRSNKSENDRQYQKILCNNDL